MHFKIPNFYSVFTYIFFIPMLMGCQSNPSTPSIESTWQPINARDDGQSLHRLPIYRAFVPIDWVCHVPPPEESIADTTKSNCEFFIQEGNQSIRITVHTFPITDPEKRIPPQAQIARWKKQIEALDSLAVSQTPEAHGGFSGLFFEGEGSVQGQPLKVMGWSLQLATIYDRQLSLNRQTNDQLKRADFTIKATGLPFMMNQHRSSIIAFAQSFEFIDELPVPQ